MLTLALLLLTEQHLQNAVPPALKRLILSENYSHRKDAYRYACLHIIGFYQEKSKHFLLHVIHTDPLMPPKNGAYNGEESTYSPRRIALSICAEWHNPDFIPIFLEFIDYYAPDPNKSGVSLMNTPAEKYAAVKGLINIGKQSISTCIQELTRDENNPMLNRGERDMYNKSMNRRDNLVFVIWSILGYKGALQLIDDETKLLIGQPERAKNLSAAAGYLKSRSYFIHN